MFEYSGYKIDVTNAGTFVCQFADDIELTDKTLDGVRRKIDDCAAYAAKRLDFSLPVVCTVTPKRDPKNPRAVAKPTVIRCNVIGMNRTSRALQFDWKNGEVDIALPDSNANADLLIDFLAQQRRMEELMEAVRKADDLTTNNGYGRIDVGAYESEMAKLTDRHKRSLTNAR